MKLVRVGKGGWCHKFYVKPETFSEKVCLRKRGYRRLTATCLLGSIGWWVSDKHKQDA